MSHQVLARKYRPKTFANLMGQTHVSQAIGNALKSGRLHHAYLFTGTRGVGKTTIARLLAKALNCESGVVEEPCGTCDTCVEIDEGRYIDLIEVDAASKTKVEDTRELLENLHYASTRGRYKIYIIDEVHMLSGHSFNALLKTLEEPPEHVKFLLATTDPQKLPVTILSRCLKFNLKRLSLKQISDQLSYVLNQENIPFEELALAPLAVAADGSMRDALSLVDQAISYGDNQIKLSQIEEMLGNLSSMQLDKIIHCLLNQDADGLISNLHQLLDHGAEPASVLMEVINQLQQIAMLQTVPNIVNEQSTHLSQSIKDMSSQFSREEIQLYYQIALHGHKDIQISPLPRGALEMTFLRMLTFTPVKKQIVQTEQNQIQSPIVNTVSTPVDTNENNGNSFQEMQSQEEHLQDVYSNEDYPQYEDSGSNSEKKKDEIKTDSIKNYANPVEEKVETKAIDNNLVESGGSEQAEVEQAEVEQAEVEQAEVEQVEVKQAEVKQAEIKIGDIQQFVLSAQENLTKTWQDLVEQIECSGFETELFKHCFLNKLNIVDDSLSLLLGVDKKQDLLVNEKQQQRLLSLLKQYFIKYYNLDKINIVYQEKEAEQLTHTPRQVETIEAENRKQFLKNSIEQDPDLAMFREKFSATIIESSIKEIEE